MKLLFAFVMVQIMITRALCADQELHKLTEKIGEIEQIFTVREFLVKFNLMEKWNERNDKRLLLDSNGGLGSVDRTYKAEGYKVVKQFTLGGKFDLDETTNFPVAFFHVETSRRSYVYKWMKGKYVKIGEFEISPANEDADYKDKK